MKLLESRMVTYCDVCRKETRHPTRCMHCGKDFCDECHQPGGREYQGTVTPDGLGFNYGFYCLKCDLALTAHKDDLVHELYQRIEALRDEKQRWYDAFKIRAKEVEQKLDAELDKLRNHI